MKLSPLLVALAVVAALACGALWLREHDARVRETAAASRSRDSLVAVSRAERETHTAEHTADALSYEAARQRQASELRAAQFVRDAIEQALRIRVDDGRPRAFLESCRAGDQRATHRCQ